VLATAAKQAYSRSEVRRLLRVTERQLVAWESQRLVKPVETYGFSDLIALRTLVKLRQDKVPSAQIRRALEALREKLQHVENPLRELKIFAEGKKVRVEIEGRTMEPISGQLLLDFDQVELRRLLKFPEKSRLQEEHLKRASADRWFERGLELEQIGAPLEQIVEAYKKAVELDPGSAGALVNLGTLYFNGRDFAEAERYYRAALVADPEYPLAHFDLGNLYDETGDRTRALFHYQAALRLTPNYADAHYNIALLYQALSQPLKAVRHWRTYLKLDPASQWSAIARRELEKLREQSILEGARRIL
jgi:tetratricopeptide (TPR) repeat protein